jgi:hypothetical protein
LEPNEIVWSKINDKVIQRFMIHIDLENQLLTIVKSTWVYCIQIMAKSHTAIHRITTKKVGTIH